MRTLNLGILAHVDAGKTTLTERLLHAAGIVDDVGSVDRGKRLGIPCVLFVNKIDRVGARETALLQEIGERLTTSIVAMGTTRRLGSRAAAFVPRDAGEVDFTPLGEHDDGVLGALVADRAPSTEWLGRVLVAQARDGRVHPVFFGSTLTGAGVAELMDGITTYLPAAEGDADGPLSGTVFKIDRGPAGDRIAFVRLFSGRRRLRDRGHVPGDDADLHRAREAFGAGGRDDAAGS